MITMKMKHDGIDIGWWLKARILTQRGLNVNERHHGY